MPEKIVINRYASRRLYNTQSSEYVTLEEVAVLIRDGSDVEIKDRKTGEDLTRQYLLQIITEQESRGETVLPVNVLTDLVRAYSSSAKNFMPEFLSQSLDALKTEQQAVVERFSKSLPGGFNPMEAFGSASEWRKKQADIMSGMMKTWMPGADQESPPQDPKSDNQKDELANMKAQLAEMQKKLEGL